MQEVAEQNRTRMNTFGRWVVASLRSAVLLRPDLTGLRIGPLVLALLVLTLFAGGVALQRLYVEGPALFHWQDLGRGWLDTLLFVFACWVAVQGRVQGASVLLGVLWLQQTLIGWTWFGAYSAAQRWWPDALAEHGTIVSWAMVAWLGVAAAVFLARQAEAVRWRAGAVAAVAVAVLAGIYFPQGYFWYPERTAHAEDVEDRRLALTQELIEAQSAAVVSTLHDLAPQRPGVTDVYAITFAPYAGEEVFRRESRLVAELMAERFDAQGRTLSLINHADTASALPWATGLNLRRAILRAASLMDRDEDVLFLHLTSHGARDGQLAAAFDPLEVEAITPEQLRAWLDEAGVRWRVISISACYSGSWLPALTEPATLVMTAADATHTSYGCGRGSELTFFGRALYAEALRSTRSFEAAHATAREVIARREQEAGKRDGYSNPQIRMGEAIRPKLVELAARLDAAAR